MGNRKLMLYISMSLDGYLATKEDDLSFLSIVEREGEDYGYAQFTESVDTYIVGRKTYDVIKELMNGSFPQSKQFNCYVITKQKREPEDGITFYSGSLIELIANLKSTPGKHIYCDGGSEIVTELLKHQLIDEFVISIIPILIGKGKRLFKEIDQTQELRLINTQSFPSGLVQLYYSK